MGFVKRMAATAKIPVPDKAHKENELVFMHKIVQKVKKHQHSSFFDSQCESNTLEICSCRVINFG